MNSENAPTEVDAAPDQGSLLSLAETLSSLIALIQDDRLVYVNPAGCALLGHPKEYFFGRHFAEVVHPADREAALARSHARRLGLAPRHVTERLLHASGRTIWMDYSIDRIQFAGQPTTLVTGHDVTERRRIEEELRRSEARLAEAQRIAHIGSWEWDTEANTIVWSDELCRIYGTCPGEFGETLDGYLSVVHPDDRATAQRVLSQAMATGGTFEFEHRVAHPGGEVRIIHGRGEVFTDAGGTPVRVAGTGQDITESRRLENELRRAEAGVRESEERYRALVEHAPEAIMVLDVDKDLFVDANAHAEKLFGYPRERLLQMGPLDFCSQHQANGRPSCEVIQDEHRKVLDGETPTFEFTHVDASGREIHCQTRLSRLPAAGRRLIRATTTDISELKQLQEKMRHADKLAAAGALAAGVAHEIGNPLMALSMAAQSLERRTCDEYTQGKVALIREHIDRISRIVRQMNELARPQSGESALCDLNAIVRRAVDMARYDKRAKGSEIHYELAAELPAVTANEDKLAQVCINLALNAFDAMAANPLDRARRLTIRSAATETRIRVEFQDTGPGVPFEIRGKLFEPFFTTKKAGYGSGLGLSVSYRILEEHEGVLRLDETPQSKGDAAAASGATFVFELPHARR